MPHRFIDERLPPEKPVETKGDQKKREGYPGVGVFPHLVSPEKADRSPIGTRNSGLKD